MTIYREVAVTRQARDDLRELGALLTLLAAVGGHPLGRYACTVQDIVERWDESPEATFPHTLERHIDVIAGVL